MRITEKNAPILKYLKWTKSLYEHKDFSPEKRDIFLPYYEDVKQKRVPEMLKVSRRFAEGWSRFQPLFSKEINVISEPFFHALEDNGGKLLVPNLMKFFYNNPVSGTLIKGKLSICYFVEGIGDDQIEGEIIAMYEGKVLYMINKDGAFTSKQIEDKFDEYAPMTPEIYYTSLPVLFHLFKKYAEVDVVDAKPFKKVRIQGDGNKEDTLMVDSYLPVKYYDCSWYRTIVRKEGFLVRGHMRCQPYKNEKGEWDYKLIFIEPYQKHGYTRTAKKIVAQRKGE